jgi:hypothetical protein
VAAAMTRRLGGTSRTCTGQPALGARHVATTSRTQGTRPQRAAARGAPSKCARGAPSKCARGAPSKCARGAPPGVRRASVHPAARVVSAGPHVQPFLGPDCRRPLQQPSVPATRPPRGRPAKRTYTYAPVRTDSGDVRRPVHVHGARQSESTVTWRASVNLQRSRYS